MPKSLNKFIGIGNLGKDPELRYTQSGTAVASFSLALNESWKDDQGNIKEKTEWVNCVAWKKLAEVCGEYLKKGSKIFIEGKVQTRSWEKDGEKKYATEIVIDNLLMLDGAPKSNGNQTHQQPVQQRSEYDQSPAGSDDGEAF